MFENVGACRDCGLDTFAADELYMLRDDVWHAAAGNDADGMLCVACVEARLGRRLVPADFADVPGNREWRMSPRLLDRIGRTPS